MSGTGKEIGFQEQLVREYTQTIAADCNKSVVADCKADNKTKNPDSIKNPASPRQILIDTENNPYHILKIRKVDRLMVDLQLLKNACNYLSEMKRKGQLGNTSLKNL